MPNSRQESLSDEALREIAERMVDRMVKFPFLKSERAYPPLAHAIEAGLQAVETKGKLMLPNLRDASAKSVLVMSDYGGESAESRCLTYSFLFCQYDSLATFKSEVTRIRSDHGLDAPRKEIAFKDLRYGPLHRALPDFLRVADTTVVGLLFTLVVDKGVASIFGGDSQAVQDDIVRQLAAHGFPGWKRDQAEKMLRVVHVQGHLLWARKSLIVKCKRNSLPGRAVSGLIRLDENATEEPRSRPSLDSRAGGE